MKLKKQTETQTEVQTETQVNPQVELLRIEAYKNATPLRVEAYSFFEFCQKVQQAINEGYKFDFDSNENFPQIYGSYLTCGMVRDLGR